MGEMIIGGLEIWRDSIMSYERYNSYGGGDGEDLLFMYQGTLKTIEALFVLKELVEIGRVFPKIGKERVDLERKELRWFPKKLTLKESMEPYEAIRRVFKKIELQRLRDYLWEFLKYGLSQGPGDDMFDFEEVTIIFKYIEKLLSVAYLLARRGE